jgi:hypothetical protein
MSFVTSAVSSEDACSLLWADTHVRSRHIGGGVLLCDLQVLCWFGDAESLMLFILFLRLVDNPLERKQDMDDADVEL